MNLELFRKNYSSYNIIYIFLLKCLIPKRMFEFSIVFLESTFKNSKEKIFHQSLYQRLLMKNFFNSLATEGGGCLTPVGMFFFCFFSYLPNCCRQWQLCKFLILGVLSTERFGLVFSRSASEKMRVGVPPPQAHFLYVCVYTSKGTL